METEVLAVLNSVLDGVESLLCSSIGGSQGSDSPASSSSGAYEDQQKSFEEKISEEDALFNEIKSLSQELIDGPWADLRVRIVHN